jgi:hypothetical protein
LRRGFHRRAIGSAAARIDFQSAGKCRRVCCQLQSLFRQAKLSNINGKRYHA